MSLLLKKKHKCNIDGCQHKTKWRANLKQHKADVHNIDVTYHYCDLCNHKYKQKNHLKQHKADVHNIDVTYHYCDIPGCKYITKRKDNIKHHKVDIHDIDVKYYPCDIPGCKYMSKRKSSIKIHKMDVHDIDVVYYHCDLCDHKVKHKCHLKLHKAAVHDIDVTWYQCDLCDHKTKQNSSLKQHKAFIHDIGNYKCGFCYNNRNSKILYEDKHGKHTICRKCYQKATNKDSRIEKTWSDYIDKQFGIELLSSSDKSLKSNGGCSLYRPDKLYIGKDIVIVGECDENQHKWNNGSYACDEKRISDIYEEQGIIGKKLIVIRWNPDNYKVPENYTKKNRKERLKIYIDLQKHLLENPPKEKIHIYYLFYDENNPRLSQRIPHTLIYD